jgi:hypothetical protein
MRPGATGNVSGLRWDNIEQPSRMNAMRKRVAQKDRPGIDSWNIVPYIITEKHRLLNTGQNTTGEGLFLVTPVLGIETR